ncbi:MAG TPA: zf-HC2 domain-containing protein [Gaiellaceae bacterium]
MRPEPELTCAEVVELVTDYLEGRLSESERRRFDEHLTECDGCTAYVEQMRTTIAVSGRLSPPEPRAEFEERLLQAFRGWRSPE